MNTTDQFIDLLKYVLEIRCEKELKTKTRPHLIFTWILMLIAAFSLKSSAFLPILILLVALQIWIQIYYHKRLMKEQTETLERAASMMNESETQETAIGILYKIKEGEI
jgi:uncharacterized membrane protein